MKTSPFNTLLFVLLGSLLVGFSSDSATRPETVADLAPFRISVKAAEGQIHMACETGCWWNSLSFTIPKDRQAVNHAGMTSLNEPFSEEYATGQPFLFNIAYRDGQIELEGLHGTAWESLQFTLPEGQVQNIDANGMVD